MPLLRINPVLTEAETPEPSVGNPAVALNTVDDASLPLNQLLAKIVQQNGAFVNITEQSVLESQEKLDEEKKKRKASVVGADVEEPAEETAAVKSREGPPSLDEFREQKEQAMAYIGQALNESSLSLDFVSLLISCVRPAAGTSSMSPHLKQYVKTGSLSSDKLQQDPNESDPSKRAAERMKQMSAGRGWKLQSLARASKDLKAASERLALEVKKEKRYWDGMLDIVGSREVVIPVKTRNRGKEIGVKYGFGDAGSEYYDKGIGLLRERKEDGELYFERKAAVQQQQRADDGNGSGEKMVQVRIYKKNEENEGGSSDNGREPEKTLVGESCPHAPRAGGSVLDDIKRARFFLFEEELFFQLTKEAATLIAMQVQVESSKVTVDFHHEVVEIAFVDANAVTESQGADADGDEEMATDDEVDPKSGGGDELPQNKEANEIGCFLRLMLCSQHRHSLEKRRMPPISMTKHSRRAVPEERILRPLMTYKRHNRTLRKLERVARTLLREAGEPADKIDELMGSHYKVTKFCNDPNVIRPQSNKLAHGDPFIRTLLSPISVCELNYKTLTTRVTLTSNNSAAYSLLAVKVDAEKKGRILDVVFNSVREAEDCLSWVVRNELNNS